MIVFVTDIKKFVETASRMMAGQSWCGHLGTAFARPVAEWGHTLMTLYTTNRV